MSNGETNATSIKLEKVNPITKFGSGKAIYKIRQSCEVIIATEEQLQELLQLLIDQLEEPFDQPGQYPRPVQWMNYLQKRYVHNGRYEEAAIIRDIRDAFQRDARDQKKSRETFARMMPSIEE